MTRRLKSHGSGEFSPSDFRALGQDVVIEAGVLVFHPETIDIGDSVYIGHRTILKGYYSSSMAVGENSWIGQGCFLHSAGGLTIGRNVGIGPAVKIITSFHGEDGSDVPIISSRIRFAPVEIGDDADIGIGVIILPGVSIGQGAQIGAGAVVTRDVADYGVAYGVPARTIRFRKS